MSATRTDVPPPCVARQYNRCLSHKHIIYREVSIGLNYRPRPGSGRHTDRTWAEACVTTGARWRGCTRPIPSQPRTIVHSDLIRRNRGCDWYCCKIGAITPGALVVSDRATNFHSASHHGRHVPLTTCLRTTNATPRLDECHRAQDSPRQLLVPLLCCGTNAQFGKRNLKSASPRVLCWCPKA